MGAALTRRPLIGVSTSEVRLPERFDPTPQGEPVRAEMALGMTYLRAIEAAGGLPVVMPPLALDAVPLLLERFDGICLSGGPDMDPEAYGARRHRLLGPTERALDRFELAVAQEVLRRDMPLLAICRGAQVLNVALGGSLEQHVPDRHGEAVDHRQREPGERPVHRVDIAPDSVLAGILGTPRAEVNSFHHQAADRLGRGLRPVAWAPDGVVEGLELGGRRFTVGVQWHAETLVGRPEQAAHFEAFVQASADGQPSSAASELAA